MNVDAPAGPAAGAGRAFPHGAVGALVGGAALAAAGPAPLFGGAPLLVLVGLGAQYHVLTRARRPLAWLYLLQLLHFSWFSASLGHVMWPGYLAVALLGPVYTVVAMAPLAGARRRGADPERAPLLLGFAAAAALAEWARASMPEIAYPHGQPVHALALPFGWLLHPLLRVGGQPLGNALLAVAGAGVALCVAARGRRSGARVAGAAWTAGAAAVAGLVALPGLVAGSPRGDAREPVRVLAVQPDLDYGLPPAEWGGFVPRARETLLEVTARLAGPDAEAPPDLVVWPENAWEPEGYCLGADSPPGRTRLPVALHPDSALLAHTVWARSRDAESCVSVAWLRDAQGRLVGWQEKAVPVPAGERPPLIEWLPAAARDAVRGTIESFMGIRHYSFLRAGSPRPPMALPGRPDVAVGAMVCFDNAFSTVARQRVAAGAQILCVLSNESWYRGGHELDQLLALTLCLAAETATPVVRATLDGDTAAVGADGELIQRLPRGEPGFLLVEVVPGAGRLPAVAWLQPLIPLLLAATWLVSVATVRGIPGILFRRDGSAPARQDAPPGRLDEM